MQQLTLQAVQATLCDCTESIFDSAAVRIHPVHRTGLIQDNAIASLVKVMREAYAEERKTLFVVGSYHIGKERAFFGAAKALDFKIWCHQAKKKVLLNCPVIGSA